MKTRTEGQKEEVLQALMRNGCKSDETLTDVARCMENRHLHVRDVLEGMWTGETVRGEKKARIKQLSAWNTLSGIEAINWEGYELNCSLGCG